MRNTDTTHLTIVANPTPDDVALAEDTADALDGELEIRGKSRIRRLAERGLTTVEYAVGLLAAATLALVLLRVFGDTKFLEALYDWVTNIFADLVKGGQGGLGNILGQLFK